MQLSSSHYAIIVTIMPLSSLLCNHRHHYALVVTVMPLSSPLYNYRRHYYAIVVIMTRNKLPNVSESETVDTPTVDSV